MCSSDLLQAVEEAVLFIRARHQKRREWPRTLGEVHEMGRCLQDLWDNCQKLADGSLASEGKKTGWIQATRKLFIEASDMMKEMYKEVALFIPSTVNIFEMRKKE